MSAVLNSVLPVTPPAAECVPAELKRHRGWLMWRYEENPDPAKKPLKVPYYAAPVLRKRMGAQGDTRDRARLAEFPEAFKFARQHGMALGFAMLADWGLVGLDFDDVFVAGELPQEVEKLVAGTYVEVSPSGNGIRAFMKGETLNRKTRSADGWPWGFETFHSNGFLTITGNVVDSCVMLGADETILPLKEEIRDLISLRWPGATLKTEGASENGDDSRLYCGDDALRVWLGYKNPACPRDEWIRAGNAVKHETEGSHEGFVIWDEWSQGAGEAYGGHDEAVKQWNSMGNSSNPNKTTARTLRHWALLAGWVDPESVPTDDGFTVATAGEKALELPYLERKTVNKQVKIVLSAPNMIAALGSPAMVDWKIAYDVFRDAIMFAPHGTDQWQTFTDEHYFDVRAQLERFPWAAMSNDMVKEGVRHAARRNEFDSAIKWLLDVVPLWDGVKRAERFFIDYFGVEDTPYARACGRYALSANAGRVLVPGIKADMVPTLIGAQGIQKSTTIAALAPDVDQFAELSLLERDDTLARMMRGKLVAEIAELRGLGVKDMEGVKAFITKQHDEWIPKYREFSMKYARRLLMYASGNVDEFLADETGNRRWLPMVATQADAAAVARDRLQLWAEGRELFQENGVMWQEAQELAGAQHSHFVVTDEWDARVLNWLNEENIDLSVPNRETEFTVAEVATLSLGLQISHLNVAVTRRVIKILRRFGFEVFNKRVGKSVLKYWKCSGVAAGKDV